MHGGSKRANALYCFRHSFAERIISLLLLCAYRGKTKSKAQTCGLPQSVSQRLLLCVKSELVLTWFFPLYQSNSLLSGIDGNNIECARSVSKKAPFGCELVLNWFSHYSRTVFYYSRVALKNYISYLFYLFHRSLFLRQLSFPRRRESTHAYCLKSLFLQRGKPSSKALDCVLPQSVSCQLTTLCQIRTRFEHGFFTCLNNKALIKKSPLPPLKYLLLTLNIKVRLLYA